MPIIRLSQINILIDCVLLDITNLVKPPDELPNNIEAEQSVIGSILLSNEI